MSSSARLERLSSAANADRGCNDVATVDRHGPAEDPSRVSDELSRFDIPAECAAVAVGGVGYTVDVAIFALVLAEANRS